MSDRSRRTVMRPFLFAATLALLAIALPLRALTVDAAVPYCSSFVTDLSVNDGTQMFPGQSFNKGWRLKDCGTARWSGVRAVRTQGSFGPMQINVPTTNAGATADMWATFAAPSSAGTYQATYQLSGPSGRFGTQFWVRIVVKAPQPPQKQGGAFCECVVYIQNYFNLSTQHHVRYARDMGSELQYNGFHQVSGPVNGAVIVFPANFGQGIGPIGHVGIVQSFSAKSGGYVVSVRGSNQRNNVKDEFTDSGCSNVDLTPFTLTAQNKGKVSYWVR